MDRKTIIIVVLLGLLVIFWIPIMTRLGFIEPPKQQPVLQDTLTIPSDSIPVRAVEPTPPPVETTPPPMQLTAGEEDTAIVIPEDSVIVETNVQRIVLSSYGGAPVSIHLKEYKYENGEPIQMLPDCEKSTPELKFNSGQFDANAIVYTPSTQLKEHRISSGYFELTYTYQSDGIGSIVKKYRFYADRYDYDLTVVVNNRPQFGFERQYSLEWNNRLMPTELKIREDYEQMWAMAMQAERIKYNDYTDNRFSQSNEGATYWVATRSKYFAAIMIPRSEPAEGVKASGLREKVGEVNTRKLTVGLNMGIEYETDLIDSFTVYVGPIDWEVLNDYEHNVATLVDIGTTPVIGWLIKLFAVPIMWLLPRMHTIIPNYGFVIIIFSLLIKLITWPLTRKTVKSMAAMRDLQPKMKELQEKYKKDPQRLNKEMMKLYKEHGVNPLSGCLPYLPQMPLFFALFSVFRSTILLRQAPFILWWTDLSRGALSPTDPYIILVVLMVVLMFLQQRMTMTDPKNKALMYIFPLMLGVFFYSVSAGLILYWTSFSLFSFLEQLVFGKGRKKAEAAVEVK